MGANCGKEEKKGGNSGGFSSNTANEKSFIARKNSKKLDKATLEEKNELDRKMEQEQKQAARQKTKALKGKALLAACLLDDGDDDFDDLSQSGVAGVPGMLNETPDGTERSTERKRLRNKRKDSPTSTGRGTGSGRSQRFQVGTGERKVKALRGKDLLAACTMEEDDDDF